MLLAVHGKDKGSIFGKSSRARSEGPLDLFGVKEGSVSGIEPFLIIKIVPSEEKEVVRDGPAAGSD